MDEVQKYPGWRFHASEPPRLVTNEYEEAELGPDWAESPAAFALPDPAELSSEPPERDVIGRTPSKRQAKTKKSAGAESATEA